MVRASSEPPLWYLDNNVFTGSANGPTASGWLELDSALSKRTQTSALAPPGFNASRFNDLASRSIFRVTNRQILPSTSVNGHK